MNGRSSVPVALLAVFGLWGCAPIEYTVVIVEASQAIASAEVAGAHCDAAGEQLKARSPVTANAAPSPGTEIASTEEKPAGNDSVRGTPQCAAPYEYYSAVEYLHKAREEVGYSDYEAAVEYARKARELAREAAKIARGLSRERGR